MQLVLHAGAHVTDEDRLVKCLLANQKMLSERGTEVPHPTHYRRLLRDVLHAALGGEIAGDTRDVLMDALGFEEEPDRLILSNAGFFGTPKMAASGGDFYTAAAPRTRVLQQIFDGDDIEIFFGICNPAIFLPEILPQTRFDTLAAYLNGIDPAQMRWSAMIERLRTQCPEVPVTVWCNEDTPLIWGRLLRDMAALEPGVPLTGEHGLLSQIMTTAGMARFETYLEQHPAMTESQKRRVIFAFLDKYADEAAIEQELDMPGWTDEVVDELSNLYDEDVHRIGRMPGVTMMTP